MRLTARQRRKLRTAGESAGHYLLHFYALPFWLLDRIVTPIHLRSSIKGRFRQVRLITGDTSTDFLAVILDALALIEKHDSRRLRRVLKEVWFIANDRMDSFGQYSRFQRTCSVNFRRIPFNWDDKTAPDYAANYEWYVAGCAATIIHEATHGRLHSLGFAYDKHTRVRIERICVAEERRFAARLPSERYDFATDLVRPYDPATWEESWNQTMRQKWQVFWQIMREIRADSKAEKGESKPDKVRDAETVGSVKAQAELPLLAQVKRRKGKK